MDEMIVYCEKVINLSNGLKSYLLDFHVDSDLSIVRNLTNTGELDQTMFYVDNLAVEKWKGFREGCFYSLPADFFREDFEVIRIENDNAIFGRLNYLGNMKLAPSRYRISGLTLQSANMFSRDYGVVSNDYELPSLSLCSCLKRDLRLTVKNVGFGNWNIISCDCCAKIYCMYDFGAEFRYNSNCVKNLLNNTVISNDFIGFISHFDLDHYKLLLDSNFPIHFLKRIYVPSDIPATKTVQRLLKKLSSYQVGLLKIGRFKQAGNRIRVDRVICTSLLDVYRSTAGVNNRNNNGLVLVVKGIRKKVILPADMHYPYLETIMSNFSNQDKVLLIPHHLGNAGQLEQSNWSALISSKDITIASTRCGVYKNVPVKKNKTFFKRYTILKSTDNSKQDITEKI